MAWFKRNYGLVIAAVISLALLACAGYYLYVMKGRAGESSAKLDDATGKLKSLYARNPFPNKENIEAAKSDEKKAEEFVQELKHFFRPPPYPARVNQREFGVRLDNVLSELTHLAKTNEITIPQDYKFSFASQAQNMGIPADALEPLTLQLAEVDTLCRILIRSKINALDAVRRPSVTAGEGLGSADFVSGKTVTNEWTITTPYEIDFRGFSPNLAEVLRGLAKASNCIVVQSVAVERAEPISSGVVAADSPFMPQPMFNPLQQSRSRSRYGDSYRPMIPPPSVALAPRSGSTNIFEEQLLKISLSLETVRLNPKPGVVPAAAPAEGAPAPEAVPVAAAGTDRLIQ